VGAVTEGQARHPSTIYICGKIEIEKRRKYPKYKYQKLKMEKIEHSLWPRILQYGEPRLLNKGRKYSDPLPPG
jgi:hypothetical protein